MFRHIAFCAGLWLASAAGAQAPQITPQDPAALFGARESVEHIDISPDGSRILYLTPGPGESSVVLVQDLTSQTPPQVALRTDGDPERLTRCDFVSNDRLICSIYVLVQEGASFLPYRRMLAVDIDGGNPQFLGQRESFFDAYRRQFDAAIIDWLPGEEGHVLMARSYVPEAGRLGTRLVRTEQGLGVDRVDVRTLRTSPVEPPNERAGGFISDGRGNVRIMAVPTVRGATGMLGSRIDFFYRIVGDGRWQPFGSYESLTREGLYPLAVDGERNVAYVLRKLGGRDALYRVSLDGSMTTELVYANEQVDVDNVVRARRGTQVIGVTFADESRRIIYFDEAYAGIAAALARAMPDLPLIDFVESTLDGNKLLIHAGSDSDPGRYFVFDRTSRSLNEILLVRPQLEGLQLSGVQPVTYPSADGVAIPGYLTLPPGRSDARGLPGVLLPHGGPEARDEWGFDWLAQYLAQRGYAVLQPNFRGSGGYGNAWLQQNGFRGWRTSIADITAGAHWLATQGADPRRMAIVGWSYGGYAALQAGAVDPDLFRAIVAIAPVTDLQQLKQDAALFTSGRNVAEYVGEGPHIVEGSPARQAARITAPVLLFHGDRDLNVLVGHSRRMNDSLRDAGRAVELVVFPGLEHDLADGDARRQMLQRIDAFLAANLTAR